MRAGAGEPALRAAHGLRHPGRTGREDQEEQVVVGDGLRRRRLRPLQLGAVLGPVYDEQAVEVDDVVEALEQRAMSRRRDHDVAVGVGDQLPQLLSPVGGVDADEDRTRQSGCGQPEHVLGRVVQQDADVQRTPVLPGGEREFCLDGHAAQALVDELAVAPAPVLEQEGGAIVVRPREQKLGRGAHRADRPAPASSGCRSALAQIRLNCSTASSKS